ncbi:hypothetical protein [Kordiimonas sp. SCSIO 12610]|uniref:hypothetical protein n=1 Tax=Kordiimonas sp. SCSIO 12610 TaxID=2829597 RepID=UPI002109571F|nr:hypothetical protein [Kordiimonas sp. SCSIO 12610]UTW54221.1 hypothetical protein KFF44_10335 [Kordiimonas sp. SCSIO 12610]
MKNSIRHTMMITAAVSAASIVYADDDVAPLDGISSIVLEIGRSASNTSDVTDISTTDHDTDGSCSLVSPKALEARVAGVGMFLDSVQNRVPAMDGSQVVEEFVTRDQNMSEQISDIEYKFAAQLQQQIAILDAENAELKARLNELQSANANRPADTAGDAEAMQAIKNAEQALAAARAAIGGK